MRPHQQRYLQLLGYILPVHLMIYSEQKNVLIKTLKIILRRIMEFHGGHYTGMEPLKIITRIKMLSFSLCCLTSCVGLTTAFDRTFHEVIIYNDSPNNISICFNIDSIGNQKGQFYSEDRLPNSSMFITAIAPNSKCRQEVWRGSWDSFFSRYKQLSVFIFDGNFRSD